MSVGDRLYLAVVAALALAAALAVVFVGGGHVPPDPLETLAGRVIQLAALTFGAVGAMAGALQVLRMYRTQSANDVSRAFLSMLTCSFVAWLAYGIALGDPVLQAVNVLGFVVTGTTLAYASRLRGRAGTEPPR